MEEHSKMSQGELSRSQNHVNDEVRQRREEDKKFEEALLVVAKRIYWEPNDVDLDDETTLSGQATLYIDEITNENGSRLVLMVRCGTDDYFETEHEGLKEIFS